MRTVLISTGGTIASRSSEFGVTAQVGGDELVAAAQDRWAGADVDVVVQDLDARSSFALSLDEMRDIAVTTCDAVREGADAVVVTHGTDSMEETAFLTDLLYDGKAPVVFTGAQCSFDTPAGDGPDNLAHAVLTAAASEAAGTGVLLAFRGAVWPAPGVRKVHTIDLDAFAGPGAPLLRRSAQGLVRTAPPTPRSTIAGALDAIREVPLPRVDVVGSYPGSDGFALEAAVRRGARAIVLQAQGIGNATPEDARQVEIAVASGIPVLVTTRVVRGPVSPVYGSGGGHDLAEAGAHFADSLSPWQARVLLAVALAMAPDHPLDVVDAWLAGRQGP